MKLLDRYVVRRFLANLVLATASAVVVFLVVDGVEQMDKFIDAQVTFGTVARYYLLYVPYIVYLTLPVATLLATLFTVGGMTMSNELSAMYASGVSFGRPLAWLLGVTCVAAWVMFQLGETVIPRANRERMDISRYEVRKLPRETRARFGRLYLQVAPGSYLYVSRFNPATQEAFGVEMTEVSEGRAQRAWRAPKMVWIDGEWRLQGAELLDFSAPNAVSLQKNVRVILPGSSLRPEEIDRFQTAPEEMNRGELADFIGRLQAGGSGARRWEVDYHFKVSLPVAAVVIVLFGAPIAAVRRRGGVALGFGLALFVCFIYFGFMQVGKVLGYNGTIPPALSAWIGNAVFGVGGIWALARFA